MNAMLTRPITLEELRAISALRKKIRATRTPGMRVVCLECGRKFSTRSMLPECPKCGGSDIEVA